MSLPHGWQNELQGLLDRLQDGGFTEQDRSRLNDLLHAGPEPQDFFITYLEIDSGLTWDGRLASDGGQPSLGGDELPPDLSVERAAANRRPFFFHCSDRCDGAFPRFVRCRFPAFPWRRTAFLPDRGDLPGYRNTGRFEMERVPTPDRRDRGSRRRILPRRRRQVPTACGANRLRW